MKVILLQDVKSVGKKDEVVDINDGYARNFILKKNLGIEATSKNLNDLKLRHQNDARLAAERLEAAKLMAGELASKSVVQKSLPDRTERSSALFPQKKLPLQRRNS